ncbi:MAG: AlpA family phage regulatory protein [Blastochloris viridis]|uniref:AlpA family phage regulatory protein n=1 Tax=Blastochloris viridis TaxID=1079 RepID=A0A6N4RBJ7_BLAVI|nr:MAG: AlpA family phage regulatory protein [Blastochloris viridis]
MEPNITHTLPNTGFLRLKDVMKFIPVSRATIYRKMEEGKFPQAYRLGSNTTAWRAEDIQAYIQQVVNGQGQGAIMT